MSLSDPKFVQHFKTETWTLYGVIAGGGSNLLTDEEILALTPKTKSERVSGSKWVYVSEYMMVLTIWTLKCCMLTIYGRITNGLSRQKLVNYCAIYTGMSFKCILLFIFSLGIFVIVAALLTKIYCLVPLLISYVYLNWHFWEATVVVLVTNLLLTWSLLWDIFPSLRNWSSGGLGPANCIGAALSMPRRPSWTGLKSVDYKLQSFTWLGSATDRGKPTLDGKRHSSPTTISSDDDGSVRSLHIRQDVTITVQSEDYQAEEYKEKRERDLPHNDIPSLQATTPPPRTPAPVSSSLFCDEWDTPHTISADRRVHPDGKN
ncbi:conserved hypothetical protein [Histoplasma capsulatum G186AR]|uniref:Uncharacterized protein n=1 Tax=Ajellomyces capsulatus (strain G186AR / H82 / ATCC MYA-2454 / RMSCC 2432) TaxID=447093 RepID=C0NLU2_AJECG|nr:uncharacterized protein HCBG_04472 [Histoplasma capsulatum G186AR]EEH07593.1 conserved hypothetical protein [Histoplasma capsulatum G186AR]